MIRLNQASRHGHRGRVNSMIQYSSLLLLCVFMIMGALSASAVTSVQENFDDGALDPALEDVDSAFAVGGGVIRRKSNTDTGDRHYIRTVASDYQASNWTFDLTFTLDSHTDFNIHYIGLGEAVPNSANFAESANAIILRIHPPNVNPGGQVDLAATKGLGEAGYRSFQTIGYLGRYGTFHARIQKSGNSVSFSILDTAGGLISGTVNLATQASFLNSTNSRLFFGTALSGESFDDLSINVLTPGSVQENFDDGALDPALEDVDSAFAFGGGVIRRKSNTNIGDRHYIRTVASDYQASDWTFDLTFTINSNTNFNIHYIGLGEAVPNPQNFTEPANAVILRIHSPNIADGEVDVAVTKGLGETGYSSILKIGNLGGYGTFHARIQKSGNSVTLSILDAAGGTISGTVNLSTEASFLNGTNSHLFFGTALSGESFDDLSIAVNTAPTFVDSDTTLTANVSTAADVKSLLHVSDSDSGQTLTWSQISSPGHGTLNLSGATALSGSTNITPGGTITYTPDAGYAGSDNFTIRVSDSMTNTTRNITVNIQNSAPAFGGTNNPVFIVRVGNGATDVRLQAKVADFDQGQTLTWSQGTAPAHGTISLSGATRASGNSGLISPVPITYTPDPGYAGTDTFTLQVSDGFESASVPRTMIFTMTNTPPTFVGPDTLSVAVNSGANDIKGALHVSDMDSGETLTWIVTSFPNHGSLNVSGATAQAGANVTPGSVMTYVPESNYFGSDSFTIQVSDGYSTAIRTVVVGITPTSVQATGNMTMNRFRHSATLLANGDVLIVGGQNESTVLNSAAVYSPSSGAFTPTGSLIQGRMRHAATLLPDGKVLVTGGRFDPIATSTNFKTAEIFDPVTGTFSSTGDMTVERSAHPATLLANGKVLITGGDWNNGPSGSGPLKTAELYDPATGSFSATGSMSEFRRFHTATLLPNGRVLITGGDPGTGTAIAAAEIYDPATGAFSATSGSMSVARMSHTATLLADGKVLIAGGVQSMPGSALSSAELFDPSTEMFSPVGAMTAIRANATATLLSNGTVLIAGGFANAEPTAQATTEIYDPSAHGFIAGPAMNAPRGLHTATPLDVEKVLLVGGPLTSSADFFETDLSARPPIGPVLLDMTPGSAVGGAGGITLAVQGRGYYPGLVVTWNGAVRATTFHDSAMLTAQISGADLPVPADLATATVAVEGSGGASSEHKPFTIKAANIGPIQAQITEPGTSAVVQVLPSTAGEPGVSANFTNVGGSPATVTTAAYTSNPVPGGGIDTGGGVVDLQINGADASDSATVKFYYSSSVTGPTEAALLLRYYDGTAWQDVLSSGGSAPVKDTTDNLDTTVSGGRWTVTFDNTSTPRITDLQGTYFALAINRAPVAQCKDVTVSADGNGVANAVTNDGSSDPDQSDTIIVTQTPAGPYPVGSTEVTLTVTDNHGASSSCTSIVTVIDDTPPTLTAPSPIVVNNDAGECGAVVNFTVTAQDNSAGVTVASTPASGTVFPKGTTTVTSVATDASGNTATDTFTVTVNDVEAPTLVVPSPIVVNNDAGNCDAVVNFAVIAGDNCPGVAVVSTPASGSVFPKGTTTVTSVATDASGNTITQTFTVTVLDKEAPILTVPAPIVVNTAPGQCDAPVSFSVTAVDNCSEVTVVNTPASGTVFPKGTTTVTSVAADAAGNTITKTFTVTVKDVEAPTLTVPSPIAVNATPGQCDAPVSFAVTAADNCPDVTVVSTPPSGSTFPKGITTVTSVATDASGNTTTKTFTVTVNDVEAPTLTVPTPIVVSNDSGNCGAVVNFTVTANDSCPGVTVVSTPASGSTFPKGTTTVTSVATDASGNTTTKTFTVTVRDTEAPTLSVPAPITVAAAAGQCDAVATFTVTAGDNCPGVTVVSTPPSGTSFPLGSTTVTSVATDASGNTTTKTFTITVNEHDVIGRVVLMARNSIALQQKAAILSGDVIVNEVATGQVLADGVELSIGQNATTPAGYQVKANRISLSQKAVLAGDVYYNSLNNGQNTTIGARHTPVLLPVFCQWPTFESGATGTQDINVQQNGTLTLNGGSYRDISIKQKGTIVFAGGVYNLCNLDVGQNAKVLFAAPTVVHIADKLAFDQKTIVGPNVGSGIGADDIVFYVNGINGTTGKLNASPEAVKIGQNSAVRGNIYAPNGTLTMEQKSSGTGAFLAKDIAVGQEVELTLESRFGSAGTGNGLLSLGQHVTKSSLAPVIAGPDLLNNGTVELQFTGTPGMGYQVQASEDLQQWEIVDEVRMGREGLIRFEEPASEDRAVRFYRVVPMESAGSGNQ